MHRLLPIGAKAGSWSPALSPSVVRLCTPLRRMIQRRQYRIDSVEVDGMEQLSGLLDQSAGVMITPNHVCYPDPFLLAEAASQSARPFYFMTAWQVFGRAPWIQREVLRRIGCFSVDREGNDVRAFRTAVEILKSKPNPLVVFPEGEMHHTNDLITPFHEGAARMLLTAAGRSDRAVACLPAALRYEYTVDPTPELLLLIDELESKFFWRPRSDMTLVERIYRVAEAALALKEIEQLGETQTGLVPDRLRALCQAILERLETQAGLNGREKITPVRVKQLRQFAISELKELSDDSPKRTQLQDFLDDIFLATQLSSYPGDYLTQNPDIERTAETLDKLEEDILGVAHARVRGRRRARLRFGEPIPIPSDRKAQPTSADLTHQIEAAVQAELNYLAQSVAATPNGDTR